MASQARASPPLNSFELFSSTASFLGLAELGRLARTSQKLRGFARRGDKTHVFVLSVDLEEWWGDYYTARAMYEDDLTTHSPERHTHTVGSFGEALAAFIALRKNMSRTFTTPPVRFSRTRYGPPEDATGTIARTWQPVTSGNTTKWTAWSDEELNPDDPQGRGTRMRIELTRKALGAPVGNFLASIFAGALFKQITDQLLKQDEEDEDY